MSNEHGAPGLSYAAFRELAVRKSSRKGRRNPWKELVLDLEDGVPSRVDVKFGERWTSEQVEAEVKRVRDRIRAAGKALTKSTGYARYSFVEVVDVGSNNGATPQVWACIPLPGDVKKWDGRWSASVAARGPDPSPRPAPSQRA